MRPVSAIALVTLPTVIAKPDCAVTVSLNGSGTAFIRPSAHDGTTTENNRGNPTFWNFQASDATPNQSFALGLQERNGSKTLVGSLTVTLIAGHQSRLYRRNNIRTLAAGDPPADRGAL